MSTLTTAVIGQFRPADTLVSTIPTCRVAAEGSTCITTHVSRVANNLPTGISGSLLITPTTCCPVVQPLGMYANSPLLFLWAKPLNTGCDSQDIFLRSSTSPNDIGNAKCSDRNAPCTPYCTSISTHVPHFWPLLLLTPIVLWFCDRFGLPPTSKRYLVKESQRGTSRTREEADLI